jgi:56kDa selenium binding protein (SBP56)
VSCWGTGELKQYDVSDPHNPKETGSVRLGGIVDRAPHPAAPEMKLAGAPQMVELSRDGRRVYFTNSLYASWEPRTRITTRSPSSLSGAAPSADGWRWLMHREGDALREAGWHVEHNRHDGHPVHGWTAEGPDEKYSYIQRSRCCPAVRRLEARGIGTICASLSYPSDY